MWFQNRRMKCKKQQTRNPSACGTAADEDVNYSPKSDSNEGDHDSGNPPQAHLRHSQLTIEPPTSSPGSLGPPDYPPIMPPPMSCPYPLPTIRTGDYYMPSGYSNAPHLNNGYSPSGSEYYPHLPSSYMAPNACWMNQDAAVGSENSSPSIIGPTIGSSDQGSALSQLGSPPNNQVNGIVRGPAGTLTNLMESATGMPSTGSYQTIYPGAYLGHNLYPPATGNLYEPAANADIHTHMPFNFPTAHQVNGEGGQAPEYLQEGYPSVHFSVQMQAGVQSGRL